MGDRIPPESAIECCRNERSDASGIRNLRGSKSASPAVPNVIRALVFAALAFFRTRGQLAAGVLALL